MDAMYIKYQRIGVVSIIMLDAKCFPVYHHTQYPPTPPVELGTQNVLVKVLLDLYDAERSEIKEDTYGPDRAGKRHTSSLVN